MRLYYPKLFPEGIKALSAVQDVVQRSADTKLLELVKVRASQINGCARCIEMHTAEARRLGESEERLYLLDAWPEAQCYSDRERAALAWCEALTQLPQSHAPDEVYEDLMRCFSSEEAVVLTLGIALINAWNRLSVGFRLPAGERRPQASEPAGEC